MLIKLLKCVKYRTYASNMMNDHISNGISYCRVFPLKRQKLYNVVSIIWLKLNHLSLEYETKLFL